MNFVKASLKYPQVTITVLVLVFIIGVHSLFNMPRREDPKITIRTGLVMAVYPGANSAQVEEQVTKKLEQYLFQFEEVKKEKTFSTSRDGMSVINVELEENVKNTDIFWSKLRHELMVAKVLDLPVGVKGPFVNSDFGDTEALVIGIESDSADYAQLKEYTQKLEDAIRTIPAVSKIKRIGEQKEQIRVSSSSERLAQYGISLPQVVAVLQSQNAINPTGDIKSDISKVPLYTKGYYSTESELANQIVTTSSSGAVVRLSDVTEIKRVFQEPTQKITVNGHKAMMLAVEMHEGNNIVRFGDQVKDKIAEVQEQLPSNVRLTTIVNQPKLVDENITHFIREFFLAILSVVIVVILLLPFRIAAVAAMAIPMTVAVTFAFMHWLGIELHQVSLAALIVVLGMVVDDAIVIADNYVELLDAGVERWTAAWRSATDLVIPVLTATFTIVAAFMPMIILTGSVGEFIFALPITVAIALTASFIVAMVLTPLLCYTFIKKGLHDHSKSAEENDKSGSLLDKMQRGYDWLLEWCMHNQRITIAASIITIFMAGGLFFMIKQKFFPAAERNQFVVELWMPSGTKLDRTEEAILRVEREIKNDKRVTSYATFIGTSAPRFYYNFSPEVPVNNYAQILVNTTTDKTTEELSNELTSIIDTLIPEGMPAVKLMQQGNVLKAPVEIRVVGDNIGHLQTIGDSIQKIIKSKVGSAQVRTDFKEDCYGVSINLKDEASRLGFTTSSISKLVYMGFSGAPITTMYEGNNPIEILMQLDEKDRQNFDDLQNMYLTSPATGANVPLRQIADIKVEWQKGRIMHRNGIRTLTVQSETKDGVLPSQLLKSIQPELKNLQLPKGYRIEIGGEHANKVETFSQMVKALGISLVLIFLILLFQFRNIKEAALVMFTIPLSLFGALLGLVLTGNNFGFTAFVGLISLSGIVVRNAIILIDYTNELIKEGMDHYNAAVEAGKRRLRPIFLTAMAAAIGVLPMIISGSPMWSPLASVISVGVMWSMIMALVTIPVLYVRTVKRVKVIKK